MLLLYTLLRILTYIKNNIHYTILGHNLLSNDSYELCNRNTKKVQLITNNIINGDIFHIYVYINIGILAIYVGYINKSLDEEKKNITNTKKIKKIKNNIIENMIKNYLMILFNTILIIIIF